MKSVDYPEIEKEVILTLKEFEKLVNYTKELEKANKALNDQIRKYNEYAKAQNELEKE